jgi:hypothetical protein
MLLRLLAYNLVHLNFIQPNIKLKYPLKFGIHQVKSSGDHFLQVI